MESNFKIGVCHTKEGNRQLYDREMYEYVFGLHFLSHLKCRDWRLEQWVKKRGAVLLKKEQIEDLPLWLASLHHKEISSPRTDHLTIRWINSEIGYGLYTEELIPQWNYVGEYSGILRPRGLFSKDINEYCFMYPYLNAPWKPLTVDSERWGNHTRFINHSDQPNLESYSFFDGMFRLGFRALREIQPGEELSYDYGDTYWLHRTKI